MNMYSPKFSSICQYSTKVYEALIEVKNAFCDPLTSTFQGKGKISLAKLVKLKAKQGGSKCTADLLKQLDLVTTWYTDFKHSLPMAQSDLKKRLKAKPQQVLDDATRLICSQKKMRLELEASEQKQLDKCRKWAQLTVDCNALLKQVAFSIERVYEVKSEVNKIRCLDRDIESIL